MKTFAAISTFVIVLCALTLKAQTPPFALSELHFNSDYEAAVFSNLQGGNTDAVLPLLFTPNKNAGHQHVAEFRNEIESLVTFLKKKQAAYKDDSRFLSYLFYKVHRKYLKQYEPQTDFFSLLEHGRYDCVTGTAFYAILLEELGYDYVIKELEYHIYLTVQPQHGTQKDLPFYVFEATDPESGFISDRSAISKIKALYENEAASKQVGKKSGNMVHQFDFEINNNISLPQLTGLAYYNNAIVLYNNQQFSSAEAQLKKAMYIYNSKRLQTFMDLIKQTVAQNPLAKNSVGK